ncbi:MAG: fatty acid desaturase [Acidimicrobiales bacterium]|nr:fatty acid desaturase [Acidimicrobiales bacterium]
MMATERQDAGRMVALQTPPTAELGGDLLLTSARRRAWTLGRPLLLTVAFFWLATQGWWVLALATFPFLFLSQVVALNDVIHRSIGLGPAATETALTLLGLLVVESGHLLQVTHLAHHRQGGGSDDPESYVDLLPMRRLLPELPLYRFRIWTYGWRHGRRCDRTWAAFEIAGTAAIAAVAVGGWTPSALRVFVVLSIVGGWAFPFVSAMGPHADWGRDHTAHCHRVKGRLLPMLMLDVPFHLEHHLYPDVPSHRLAELSRMLAPLLDDADIKEVRVW